MLELELERLAALLDTLFGYHLLHIGGAHHLPALRAARVQHCAWLAPDIAAPASSAPWPLTPCAASSSPPPPLSRVTGRPDALPFASDSTDIVVLPHVLEFEADPFAALREAERVLVPEGHVVVVGWNAMGLMGAWRHLPRAGGRNERPPWNGRFHTPGRVRGWLAELGFDTVTSEGRYYRPPVRSEAMLRRLEGLETIGPRLCPWFCGLWFLVARKRVSIPTAIRPAWRRRRRTKSIREAGIAGSATMTARGPARSGAGVSRAA